MQTKLQAVKTATAVGESVILANGTHPGVLDRILAGDEVGTLFLARGQSLPAWKRWIGYSVPPGGRFVLDAGACRAVAENGRSLLAIGIVSVDGTFDKGAIVSLVDAQGVELARGLSNFSAGDVLRIAGRPSHEIPGILGDLPYAEVVHRDNLVVTR